MGIDINTIIQAGYPNIDTDSMMEQAMQHAKAEVSGYRAKYTFTCMLCATPYTTENTYPYGESGIETDITTEAKDTAGDFLRETIGKIPFIGDDIVQAAEDKMWDAQSDRQDSLISKAQMRAFEEVKHFFVPCQEEYASCGCVKCIKNGRFMVSTE